MSGPAYRAGTNAGVTGAIARPALAACAEPERILSDSAGEPASNAEPLAMASASLIRLSSFAFILCKVFKEASLQPLHALLVEKP